MTTCRFLFLPFLFILINIVLPLNNYALAKTKGLIKASLIIDLDTNKILHADNHHARIYPASLTKLMTLYIVFDKVKRHKLHLRHNFIVSENASKQPASKLYLKAHQSISVNDAVLALIVKSANDVAVTVAENIAGSEERFAVIMNATARKLGMKNTYFRNASGWHDNKQYTTASDLSKLAKALKRDFPEFYHFFKNTTFSYEGKIINGHNKVTKYYPGAEGLKTGFTNASGFNLITIASNGKKRVAAIVIGHNTGDSRDKKMVELLNASLNVNYSIATKSSIAFKASTDPVVNTNKKVANSKLVTNILPANQKVVANSSKLKTQTSCSSVNTTNKKPIVKLTRKNQDIKNSSLKNPSLKNTRPQDTGKKTLRKKALHTQAIASLVA